MRLAKLKITRSPVLNEFALLLSLGVSFVFSLLLLLLSLPLVFQAAGIWPGGVSPRRVGAASQHLSTRVGRAVPALDSGSYEPIRWPTVMEKERNLRIGDCSLPCFFAGKRSRKGGKKGEDAAKFIWKHLASSKACRTMTLGMARAMAGLSVSVCVGALRLIRNIW